jgi:hypothetical protein
MLNREKTRIGIGLLAVAGSLLLVEASNFAQDKPKRETIQAQAMGQSTQLGQTFAVNVVIEEYSTADDQKVLVDAFNQKGNEGVVNALNKMKSKGHISVTGTLGYDVNYIRQFPNADGSRKIRLVTNRPIRFGEAWTDSRSMEYSLSGMEVILPLDKKKNSGTLLPAFKFNLDKQKELEFELLQNAWKLVDIRVR